MYKRQLHSITQVKFTQRQKAKANQVRTMLCLAICSLLVDILESQSEDRTLWGLSDSLGCEGD
jgi:hypothetical protein